MPTPIATAFLVFGAVLLALSVVAGVIVAGVGLLIELLLFYRQGIQ